jgi:hypothetical protein
MIKQLKKTLVILVIVSCVLGVTVATVSADTGGDSRTGTGADHRNGGGDHRNGGGDDRNGGGDDRTRP